jgi:hypothetical protein
MSMAKLECAACGLSLGLGTPGSTHWCSRCAEFGAVHAARGDFDSTMGALVFVGIGLVIALILLMLLGGRR